MDHESALGVEPFWLLFSLIELLHLQTSEPIASESEVC